MVHLRSSPDSLSDAVSPRLLHDRSPQQFLTVAASWRFVACPCRPTTEGQTSITRGAWHVQFLHVTPPASSWRTFSHKTTSSHISSQIKALSLNSMKEIFSSFEKVILSGLIPTIMPKSILRLWKCILTYTLWSLVVRRNVTSGERETIISRISSGIEKVLLSFQIMGTSGSTSLGWILLTQQFKAWILIFFFSSDYLRLFKIIILEDSLYHPAIKIPAKGRNKIKDHPIAHLEKLCQSFLKIKQIRCPLWNKNVPTKQSIIAPNQNIMLE